MINRLLQILHRHPITSTAILLVAGIAMIFITMVFLSQITMTAENPSYLEYSASQYGKIMSCSWQ
jgi:hypothetical protein